MLLLLLFFSSVCCGSDRNGKKCHLELNVYSKKVVVESIRWPPYTLNVFSIFFILNFEGYPPGMAVNVLHLTKDLEYIEDYDSDLSIVRMYMFIFESIFSN